jgi:hypothetical protein
LVVARPDDRQEGQPDASGAMSGGNYSVTGGFWSLIQVVQTPGAPLLIITHVGNQAVVSWDPSATGWTLQTNNNLSTGTWGNYPGLVVNNSATTHRPRARSSSGSHIPNYTRQNTPVNWVPGSRAVSACPQPSKSECHSLQS